MYEHLTKIVIFQAPHRYAWNILLREFQFTQEELLIARDYVSLPEMIRFQHAATMEFLREHYQKDIDDCLEVDWNDCANWIAKRT